MLLIKIILLMAVMILFLKYSLILIEKITLVETVDKDDHPKNYKKQKTELFFFP